MPSLMVRCPSPIRSGAPATRALRKAYVEVPRSTIEGFIKFGFIRPDQQNDLTAILGALRLLGEEPVVRRIA
jgi:hypothetical protein